jgi:hypothetical protein
VVGAGRLLAVGAAEEVVVVVVVPGLQVEPGLRVVAS